MRTNGIGKMGLLGAKVSDMEQRSMSRRRLLGGSAKIAAAGAVAAAFAATPLAVGAQEESDRPDHCLDIDENGEINDLDVLQFALTLEHLENAFYRDGIAAFSAADFQRAFRGLRAGALETSGMFIVRGTTAYDFFSRIGGHESTHVETLSTVISDLGSEPVQEATYNFGEAYSRVEVFVQTAQLLENTGVMAYDGAIDCLKTPKLLRSAASIATVEARHADYCDIITGNLPFPEAFDTPTDQADILEAAGGFIES